ncbi:MAG TPA: AAA family ATPase [Planctomycetaceae bacterium]|jgi:energy-coupling factor transporter ATP-binding protein EcfA2|nr:AAA family ATPase [Planctomycetaceae bacterium]
MKLRKIHIQNFRAIENREIRFDDAFGAIRPVTVLAGPNGCGKTSALFAIVQPLRGVMGYRSTDVPDPDDLDIHRKAAVGGLVRKPLSVTINLDVEFEQCEIQAIPKVFEDTRDLRFRPEEVPSEIGGEGSGSDLSASGIEPPEDELPPLPDRRIQVTWTYPPDRQPNGRLKPWWFLSNTDPWKAVPWFYGRKYAIRGWINRRLRDRSLLDDVGGLYLFPQDRNLQSRVVGNLAKLPGIQDRIAEERHRALEQISVWGILQYLSNYAQGQEKRLDDGSRDIWEERIREGFRRICSPKEYLGFMYQTDDPVGAPYFKDGNSVYPLQMAASGEQVIIEYLTRLTYPSPLNHSLILIDEPEIHLHPGWIRQLYRALPRIGVGNQFILTTHSIELREMAAEDGALVEMGDLVESP